MPYVLSREDAPAFWLIDNLWMPLATGVLTQNRLALLEQVCAEGIGGPPTHTHDQDEGFYVLEGACSFQAGGQAIHAPAGTFVFVPRDTDHSFQVVSPGTRVLNFYTPAGFEMILMSIAAPALRREPPPPHAVPMPPAAIVEVLSRLHGQRPTGGLPFVDFPTPENSTTKASSNPFKPYAVDAGSCPAYDWEGLSWRFLATSTQTGGSFSLFEVHANQGDRLEPHSHPHHEALYLIEGTLQATAGESAYRLGPGHFLYLPDHALHSLTVESPTARFLHFCFPGGLETCIQTSVQGSAERSSARRRAGLVYPRGPA